MYINITTDDGELLSREHVSEPVNERDALGVAEYAMRDAWNIVQAREAANARFVYVVYDDQIVRHGRPHRVLTYRERCAAERYVEGTHLRVVEEPATPRSLSLCRENDALDKV